jgi:hypothetical protein
MLMGPNPPADPRPRWADNSNSWPALAAMLAPGAGCDCQMLAIVIADSLDLAPQETAKTVPTATEQ